MLKQIKDIIKLVTVFTSGLFLGMIAGLLTAPKSGKELRKDIADGTLKLKELTKDKIEDLEDAGVNQARKFGHAHFEINSGGIRTRNRTKSSPFNLVTGV